MFLEISKIKESFDGVMIANALHIMPNPDAAMREIYRVLKPNGLLFAPTFFIVRATDIACG